MASCLAEPSSSKHMHLYKCGTPVKHLLLQLETARGCLSDRPSMVRLRHSFKLEGRRQNA